LFRPFWTLAQKEVLRFLSVSFQTLVAPTINATLYLFIFGVSLGTRIGLIQDVTFLQYVIPGLIMMGVVNNSFQNTASSLFISRLHGNIVDLLVSPITPTQFIMAYTLAAILRGVLVGVVIWFITSFFTALPWTSPLQAALMVLLASFLFAQLGIIAAIHSQNFEHLAMYNNFLILPLVFLGGVFYPISNMKGFWGDVSRLNPLYYMIDGFRQGMLGVGENAPWLSFLVTAALALSLFAWAALLITRGYKLRT